MNSIITVPCTLIQALQEDLQALIRYTSPPELQSVRLRFFSMLPCALSRTPCQPVKHHRPTDCVTPVHLLFFSLFPQGCRPSGLGCKYFFFSPLEGASGKVKTAESQRKSPRGRGVCRVKTVKMGMQLILFMVMSISSSSFPLSNCFGIIPDFCLDTRRLCRLRPAVHLHLRSPLPAHLLPCSICLGADGSCCVFAEEALLPR